MLHATLVSMFKAVYHMHRMGRTASDPKKWNRYSTAIQDRMATAHRHMATTQRHMATTQRHIRSRQHYTGSCLALVPARNRAAKCWDWGQMPDLHILCVFGAGVPGNLVRSPPEQH